MLFFYIICIIFLSMLIFPIGVGLTSKLDETKPLFIQQSNSKDPRYFAASFKKIFDKAWETYDGSGILHMSREEQVIEADKSDFLPCQVCTSLVYAENLDFFPNEGVVFEKEIYARKNARLQKIPAIRAIACKGDLILGTGIRVIRWADSEGTLTVYNDCDLGISTTSATQLLIGENCLFKRLYAPVIWLGKRNDELDKCMLSSITREENAVVFLEIMRDIKYVDDEVANQERVLQNTVITKHDITVLGGYSVQGHIRSHKDIKIDDNATVHGNIFAEGNIFIGTNAKVFGVVFSQENVFIEDGAVIGQPGKIKSIVARGNIIFGRDCRVHGYIGTEGIGSICPKI